ncbi:MAG TPA: ATP phosphoribosyltransferase regulatory subunit [Holophagaceae bacterium]|nr:ATP phosphoribosyltransferase regulatory subunit [Holophagaceae bacterium]
MPTHTPHFPDLLFAPAARLRTWESALMGLLRADGYRELHPSLILREPLEDGSVASPFVQFFDGPERVALRSDFTLSLARLLSSRFTEPPPRICYAGAVFRRPTQPWEAVERFEVGCERLHLDRSDDADLELARLLMAVPGVLGLKGGLLQLGHAALLRKPLEAEGVSPDLKAAVVSAMSRRAPHRLREALRGHPAEAALGRHAELLLAEPDGDADLAPLEASPYANLLAEELAELRRAARSLSPMLPEGLTLRIDCADVEGLDFYTGPTLRLWTMGAQAELASGGRYDRLYPDLGRPWRAAGFCVRLSRLLDLADTRPDLFTELP